MGKYDDIIDLPHYRSPFRTPMPVENRGAQFAPFAALAGHDDAIAETARLTDVRLELTEEEKYQLSLLIQKAHERRMPVIVTYFLEDTKKEGGEYRIARGVITKIDELAKTVTLDSGQTLSLHDMVSVTKY